MSAYSIRAHASHHSLSLCIFFVLYIFVSTGLIVLNNWNAFFLLLLFRSCKQDPLPQGKCEKFFFMEMNFHFFMLFNRNYATFLNLIFWTSRMPCEIVANLVGCFVCVAFHSFWMWIQWMHKINVKMLSKMFSFITKKRMK